jgi:hypothetical protein
MVGIISFYRDVSLSTSAFTPISGDVLEGALALLEDETDGYAIDATTYDSVTAASYVGGPVGGTVATIDTGTPSNDLSNVPLDASNLVNSGTSPKMVHNASSPYVRWSAHNQLLRSEEFDDATAWTKGDTTITADNTTAPDGNTTADLLTCGTAGNDQVIQDVTSIASREYTFSVYLKKGNHDWVRLVYFVAASPTTDFCRGWFDLTNGVVGSATIGGTATSSSVSIESVGSGWYRCSLTGNLGNQTVNKIQVSSVTADAVTTRVNNGTRYQWGAQFNRGPIATPYLATTTAARIGIPLSYDAAAAQYGMLVEPAATNVLLRSQEFDNASWVENNVAAISAGSETAPDGTATAETITSSSGTAAHLVYQSVVISASTTYAHSYYVKKGTHRYIAIDLQGAVNHYACAVFDLDGGGSTATETSVGASSGTIVSTSQEAIGNGWYRLNVSASAAGTNQTMWIGFASAATGNSFSTQGQISWNAAGTETFHVWGAQLELGSVATSYIPTLGSTVTRAADNVTATTTTFPFSATLGNINASIGPRLANNATANRIFRLDANATNDNEIIQVLYITGDTPDSFGCDVFDGAVQQVTSGTTKTGSVSTSGNKVSLSWAANDFSILADGGTEVNDTSATLPTVTRLRLGASDATASRELNGHIYSLSYFPLNKTEAEMIAKQALLT